MAKPPVFVIPPAPAAGSKKLSYAQLRALWVEAGGAPALASTMAAVALAESGGRIAALNDNPKTGDYSVGPWQINYFGGMRPGRTAEFGSPAKLQSDPLANAKAAVALVGDGSGLSNWTTYNSGAYQAFYHPATPQEKVASATATDQAAAASPAYNAAAAAKSGALAAAKVSGHETDPWVTVIKNKSGVVTGFGEAIQMAPPKNVLMIGGVPATKALYVSQWSNTYANEYTAYTGRQATAAEQAKILESGQTLYQLKAQWSKQPTFTSSPIYQAQGPGLADQLKQQLGTAPPKAFVADAIAQNWDAATISANLKKLPGYFTGPAYQQAYTDMSGAYKSIYGPTDPSVQQDIKQHILTGWTPTQYAAKLRAQPQYKYSPEAQDSALHFLDGMGLLIGSRPTLTAGGKTNLPGAPGMTA